MLSRSRVNFKAHGNMHSKLSLSLALGYLSAHAQSRELETRIDNGIGRTPAMGWNSWVCICVQYSTINADILTRMPSGAPVHQPQQL